MLVMNASPRGPMCFRCLMFSFWNPVSCYFYLVYLFLDLNCGECNVISLYFLCCPVNESVCLVCSVFDSVCELFGETIPNIFERGCYFVVECHGGAECGWSGSVG